ncbi:glycosyltransferase, partial [Halorubrum sp. SS5]
RKDSLFGALSRPMIRYLRMRDMAVDPRVDHYFVNSPIIERRLWKYYKRDSEVLYPPVDLDRYYNQGDHGFYLHLGRLDIEKGVPEVVTAFEDLDERLVMVGGAGDIDEAVLDRIKRAENIEWRGFVDETEKFELLARCTAVVFNGHNEDFGIVSIEANASGKAVLTRKEGFPAVFIDDGENGYHHNGKSEDIRELVKYFDDNRISGDPTAAADSFGVNRFLSELQSAIIEAYNEIKLHANI